MESTQLVFTEGGRVFTDSLIVSKVFDKEHKNVVRDIEVQMSKLREGGEFEFSRLNFEQSDYVNERGRTYSKYVMTEDGFAMIAMSYVTPAAMRMKVAFLAEFKRMRERLVSIVTPSYAIDDPIERAQRWIAERQERDRIESERLLLAHTVEEQAERLTYLDEILRSEDTMTVSQIAADYDLLARDLNTILKGEGVQRRTGGQWVLRSKFHGRGLTKSKTFCIDLPDGREKTVVHTRWTQAGRLLIHQILTEKGISALIDRHIKNATQNVVVLEPRRPSTITLSLRLDA